MNERDVIVLLTLAGCVVLFCGSIAWGYGAFDGWSPRKWFRRGPGDQFASLLESALDTLLDAKAAEWREELQGLRDLDTVRAEKRKLEDQVRVLDETMKDARRDIEREREEIEFKLGLEQQRRDQEHTFATEKLDSTRAQLEAEKGVAVREAGVGAREEALKVAATQMQGFVDEQAELIKTLTEALPKAELLAKIGNGS